MTFKKTPAPVDIPFEYTFTFTREEARALWEITHRIGGSPELYPRRVFAEIGDALESEGLGRLKADGNIYF